MILAIRNKGGILAGILIMSIVLAAYVMILCPIISFAGVSSITYIPNPENDCTVSLDSGPQEEWQFSTDNKTTKTPIAFDVIADSQLEIFVGSRNRNMYCIAANGTKLWNFTTETSTPMEGIGTMATVSDIDGDSHLEVIFGAFDGNVYCLDAETGTFEWSYLCEGQTGITGSNPTLGKISDEAVVIIGIEEGILCLNGVNGTKRWMMNHEYVASSPSITDCDNDGIQEVVYGTNENRVYCRDIRTGYEEWNITFFMPGSVIWSSPLIIEEEDMSRIIIVTIGGEIWEIDGVTQETELIGTVGTAWATPSMADIDGDGNMEIVTISWEGNIAVFDIEEQVMEWNRNLNTNSNNGPCIVDVDRDGEIEILVATTHLSDGRLLCFDSSGNNEWEIPIDRVAISSVLAYDIDLDEDIEIVFSSESGIYCYDVPGTNGLAFLWPAIGERGGAYETGDWKDSDHDNLPDSYEIFAGTDPYAADSDLDGLIDSREFAFSTDPLSNDTDQDLLPDSWEVQWELNPLWAGDANLDAELDGLANLEEYQYGTNPRKMDSDSDTLKDIEEIQDYGTSPISNDTDSDLLSDPDELFVYGTNPLSADTDGDGYSDFTEIQVGCDPLVPDWLCHNKVSVGITGAIGVAGVVSIILFKFRNKIKNR